MAEMMLLLYPIFFAVPAIILYFIIKLAVKHAIKETREDDNFKY